MDNARSAGRIMEGAVNNAREGARRTILRLVREAGPGGLEGKTRLNKAFHAAHVFYLRETGLDLTTWPIVHLPNGPGVDHVDDLLGELTLERQLVLEAGTAGPYATTIYRLGPAAEDVDDESAQQARAIVHAITYVAGKSAGELSHESHERSRAWQRTKDGQVMDLVLDVMTDEELRTAEGARDASERELAGLFGD